MTFEEKNGPCPTDTFAGVLWAAKFVGWNQGQEAMRDRAAALTSEWNIGCDHAGEIVDAIHSLPIE